MQLPFLQCILPTLPCQASRQLHAGMRLVAPHQTSLLLCAGMQLALQASEEHSDAVLEAYTCCVDLLTGDSSAETQNPPSASACCFPEQADEQPQTA